MKRIKGAFLKAKDKINYLWVSVGIFLLINFPIIAHADRAQAEKELKNEFTAAANAVTNITVWLGGAVTVLAVAVSLLSGQFYPDEAEQKKAKKNATNAMYIGLAITVVSALVMLVTGK
ncbi:hypothetical protein [Enterococcus sp. BWR-S5]|uniref:hypothetical protein n=1 Tax=Enterococcus sp. BWR-S5 TaxID=2787714 RepID=UPI0019242D0A|nr:hypothetical protein [Enterococcus sp. BWR-S5]MBL1227215.1 hypothetical protein [Enterococcus sp. BWR-S5]